MATRARSIPRQSVNTMHPPNSSSKSDKLDSAFPPVQIAAPSWVTAELIGHTIRVWQPYYADPLTSEEAIAIILSIGRLFEVFSGEPKP